MVLRFQSREVERTRKMEGNRGRSPPYYIEGNPSIAFAARLIPHYQADIHVTKETIQFVVNLTKEIPHRNRVTKERTSKLSQHVSHQGTMRRGSRLLRRHSYSFRKLRGTRRTGQKGTRQAARTPLGHIPEKISVPRSVGGIPGLHRCSRRGHNE